MNHGGYFVDCLEVRIPSMEFVAVEQGARRDQGDSAGGLDYRITQGANERVQLEAMLASLALGTYRPGPLRRISRSGYPFGTVLGAGGPKIPQ